MLGLSGFGELPSFGGTGPARGLSCSGTVPLGCGQSPPLGSSLGGLRTTAGLDVEAELISLRTTAEASQRSLGLLENRLAVRLEQACRRQVDDALSAEGPLKEMRQSVRQLQSEYSHVCGELKRLPAARDVDAALERQSAAVEARISERIGALEQSITRHQQAALERLESRGGETWRACLKRMSDLEQRAVLQADMPRVVDRVVAELRRLGPEVFGSGAVPGAREFSDMRAAMRKLEATVAGCEAGVLGLSEDVGAEGRIWRANIEAQVAVVVRHQQDMGGRVAGFESSQAGHEESIRELVEAADTRAGEACRRAEEAEGLAKEAAATASERASATLRQLVSELESKRGHAEEGVRQELADLRQRLRSETEARESLEQREQEAARARSRGDRLVADLREAVEAAPRPGSLASAAREAASQELARGLADFRHELKVEFASLAGESELRLARALAALGSLEQRFSLAERRLEEVSSGIARADAITRGPGAPARGADQAAAAVREAARAAGVRQGPSATAVPWGGAPPARGADSAPAEPSARGGGPRSASAASAASTPRAAGAAGGRAPAEPSARGSGPSGPSAAASAASSPRAASAASGRAAAAAAPAEEAARLSGGSVAGRAAAASAADVGPTAPAKGGALAAGAGSSDDGLGGGAAAAAPGAGPATPPQAASAAPDGPDSPWDSEDGGQQAPAALQVDSTWDSGDGLASAGAAAGALEEHGEEQEYGDEPVGSSAPGLRDAQPLREDEEEEAEEQEEEQEAPPLLRLTSPNAQQDCSGLYELVPGERPQGQPLWSLRGGERWIYFNTQDQWCVGGPTEKDLLFDCPNGFIINMGVGQEGLLPTQLEGGWTPFNGEEWLEDPDVEVSAAAGEVGTPRWGGTAHSSSPRAAAVVEQPAQQALARPQGVAGERSAGELSRTEMLISQARSPGQVTARSPEVTALSPQVGSALGEATAIQGSPADFDEPTAEEVNDILQGVAEGGDSPWDSQEDGGDGAAPGGSPEPAAGARAQAPVGIAGTGHGEADEDDWDQSGSLPLAGAPAGEARQATPQRAGPAAGAAAAPARATPQAASGASSLGLSRSAAARSPAREEAQEASASWDEPGAGAAAAGGGGSQQASARAAMADLGFDSADDVGEDSDFDA